MDTSELRRAFTLSETLYDQIKEFRRERTRLVMNKETPVTMQSESALILHLIPLESFATRLDFSVNILPRLFPLCSRGMTHRVNIDGIVTMHGVNWEANASSHSYTQMFRNAVIEAVMSNITCPRKNGDGKLLYIGLIQESLLSSLPEYMQNLSKLGIHPPIWCFLTLTRTKGLGILPPNVFDEKPPIDRDVLYLPEILIEDLATDAIKVLKPLFDMIWNAAGWEKSYNVTPYEAKAWD
jgi:hypothetical protein